MRTACHSRASWAASPCWPQTQGFSPTACGPFVLFIRVAYFGCSPCSASCSCFSASLDRDVLRTVPPYLDSASVALSVVICSTTMNSADVPGFSISRTWFSKASSTPALLTLPRAPAIRRMAAARAPPRRRPRAAASRSRDAREHGHGGVRRARPPRAAVHRRDSAQAHGRDARRADPAGGAGSAPGLRRADEPRDRRAADPQPAHGGVAPGQGVRKTRGQLPQGATHGAVRRRRSGRPPLAATEARRPRSNQGTAIARLRAIWRDTFAISFLT